MVSNITGTRETTHVTIVGGGISGLYAAYLLAHDPRFSVEVLDSTHKRLGGKIASQVIRVNNIDFRAEFGPMRFELGLQPRFRRLCQHLGISFTPFSPTGSPRILTKYEMTDVESSFDSAADLLEWAVLKMFFGAETGQGSRRLDGSENVEAALKKIEDAHPHEKDRCLIGPKQLRWLQCYLDDRLFLHLEGDQWVPRLPEEMEHKLDLLRAEQHLRGDNRDKKCPLLRDIGLWNALSEVITPGAVAKIRDSGTFYHCIVNNPSAVEYGIFWLRQASALGILWTFDEQAKDGVWTLVKELEAKLRKVHQKTGRGSIQIHREVVQIEPAKRPTEVVLRVVEHDQPGAQKEPFSLRADHVILALPQWPLRRLQEHFPQKVIDRISGVEALPLLKAFVVTTEPWWQPHLKAQSYAWLVPTRELHFYRGEKQDCPSLGNAGDLHGECTCPGDGPGMIMLYTDEPGISYWDLLIPSKERQSVLWHDDREIPPFDPVSEVENHPFELFDMLVRRLLVVPQPGLAYTINSQEQEFLSATRKCRSEPSMQDSNLDELVQELEKRKKPHSHGCLKGLSEFLVKFTEDDAEKKKLVREIYQRFMPELHPDWLTHLSTASNIRDGVISTKHVREAAEHVVAYGIRDWSAEPFGGAGHLWRPGFSAVPNKNDPQEEDPLLAFPLRERADGVRNVHICGEAFSGHQGFIEGALQTAEHVVAKIIGKDKLKEIIADTLTPSGKAMAEKFADDQSVYLAEEWERRIREMNQ